MSEETDSLRDKMTSLTGPWADIKRRKLLEEILLIEAREANQLDDGVQSSKKKVFSRQRLSAEKREQIKSGNLGTPSTNFNSDGDSVELD